jgi:hypothetical protein
MRVAQILDVDGSGRLSYDEMREGLLRLRVRRPARPSVLWCMCAYAREHVCAARLCVRMPVRSCL